jgi:hypothetical protein
MLSVEVDMPEEYATLDLQAKTNQRKENIMTRKHFAAIAATLNDQEASPKMIREMARTLSGFNTNFDKERFIAAATADDCSWPITQR